MMRGWNDLCLPSGHVRSLSDPIIKDNDSDSVYFACNDPHDDDRQQRLPPFSPAQDRQWERHDDGDLRRLRASPPSTSHGIGFNPEDDLNHATGDAASSIVHIRMQKRNGRSFITSIPGLPDTHCKKALKAMRRLLCCNGTIVFDKDHGYILQLQGDQRDRVKQFLVSRCIVASEEDIRMHGF
jgi:translation initiation factor 1